MDKIYTPRCFAEKLAAASSVLSPKCIADFTAGDGSLLIAAKERWPEADLHAFDNDSLALANIRYVINGVKASNVNFLDDHARRQCSALSELKGNCDLVLLNPPFSCRGVSTNKVEIDGKLYTCSTATAFFVRGLEYVSLKGEMLAILPSSCITSQRDREVFDKLRQIFLLKQVGGVNKSVFRGHSVGVVILSAFRNSTRPKASNTENDVQKAHVRRDFRVQISRGTFPVHLHNSRPGPYKLIHTSNLKGGEVVGERAFVSAWSRHIASPGVLIPRVGKPDIGKVVIKSSMENFIISDCLFALITKPCGFERDLKSLIIERWDLLQSMYSGSCAPYITVRQVQDLLLALNV